MGAGRGVFKGEFGESERIGGGNKGDRASGKFRVSLRVLRGLGGVADAVFAGGFGLVHGRVGAGDELLG